MMSRFVAMIVLLAACIGCKGKKADTGTDSQQIDIYFTCDTNGRIEPCGCFTGQYGGLTRVSTAMKEAPGSALKLEVGNAIGGLEDYHVLQYGYLLDACAAIGYSAVNLGERVAQLPAATIRELAAKSKVPLLSANILDAETREPLVAMSTVVTRGAVKFGIVGVVDPQSVRAAVDESVVVGGMNEALRREIEALKGKADVLVCLAFTDEAGMEDLAREFYEFDFILGGDVRQPSSEVTKVNQSYLLATTNQARALGEVRAVFDGADVRDVTGDVKLMVDLILQDADIKRFSSDYRRTVRDVILNIDRPASQAENRVPGVQPMASFVGSSACASCHAKSYAIWEKSGHAHAFETLVRKDSDGDPACISCHVVGLGEPSGYMRNKSVDHLKGVGCESCHGPASEHVRLRSTAAPGEDVLIKMRPVGEGQCVQCHHGEFSRPFVFEEFWKSVKHGKE